MSLLIQLRKLTKQDTAFVAALQQQGALEGGSADQLSRLLDAHLQQRRHLEKFIDKQKVRFRVT